MLIALFNDATWKNQIVLGYYIFTQLIDVLFSFEQMTIYSVMMNEFVSSIRILNIAFHYSFDSLYFLSFPRYCYRLVLNHWSDFILL